MKGEGDFLKYQLVFFTSSSEYSRKISKSLHGKTRRKRRRWGGEEEIIK